MSNVYQGAKIFLHLQNVSKVTWKSGDYLKMIILFEKINIPLDKRIWGWWQELKIILTAALW